MPDVTLRPIGIDDRDEQSFLDEIVADPDNDLPRLVYADWLDELGRSERADFIRLQCAAETPDLPKDHRRRLVFTANQLRRQNETRWLGRLNGSLGRRIYRRGFLWDVELGHITTDERFEAFYQWLPWGTVRFSSHPKYFAKLIFHPRFRQIHSLHLFERPLRQTFFEWGQTRVMLTELDRSTHTGDLRELVAHRCTQDCTLEAVEQFLSANGFDSLRRLTIRGLPMVPGDVVQAWLNGSRFPSLRALEINDVVAVREV